MKTEGLRIDRGLLLELKERFDAGELNEYQLEVLLTAHFEAQLAVEAALENGQGTLTEEDCDRTGTEIPAGTYRTIRVTNDAAKPKVLATIYLRTVEGELDEMWLVRSRKGQSPNPFDTFPGMPTFHPSLLLQEDEVPYSRRKRRKANLLSDARGSQGVEGLRTSMHVDVKEADDFDHRWKFMGWTVRSSKLAPVLLDLLDHGQTRVSLSLLRMAVDRR